MPRVQRNGLKMLEVSQNSTARSLWVVINRKVYDLTTYHKRHPGGAAVLLQMGGKDATEAAEAAHSTSLPANLMREFLIGTLAPGEPTELEAATSVKEVGELRRRAASGAAPAHLLEGEAALALAAELLAQLLARERRLASWLPAEGGALALLPAARAFLVGAFKGAVWPPLMVGQELLDARSEDLLAALLDLLQLPLHLGDGALAGALDQLGQSADDPRVSGFFGHIRTAAVEAATQPPTPVNEWELDPRVKEVLQQEAKQPEANIAELESTFDADADASPTLASAAAEDNINIRTFEEIKLAPEVVSATLSAWKSFISSAGSMQAAGELIYAALFEGAPSLQVLFTTPRAVQAVRFANGINSIVMALDTPAKMKSIVEALGFGHLHLEVTPPRVAIFRDAIVELLEMEIPDNMNAESRDGLVAVLNYVGGALIWVKSHYAARLKLLVSSWAVATDKSNEAKLPLEAPPEVGEEAEFDSDDESEEDEEQTNGPTSPTSSKSGWRGMFRSKATDVKSNLKQGAKDFIRQISGGLNDDDSDQDAGFQDIGDWGETPQVVEEVQVTKKVKKKKAKSDTENLLSGGGALMGGAVPTTFNEMFKFNAAIMGLGSTAWFMEVLSSFDTIVRNIANSARLQEECEVLGLRISKCTVGEVNFAQFKSCMLAALRSMLPKEWDSSYEVAWTWLWDNVERVLLRTVGFPLLWEAQLEKFYGILDEDMRYELRRQIWDRFFQMAPTGQDYFKLSTTRLHFIAQRILDMTLELYHDPWHMTEDISALGLRHVGYGIPTELISPFVTACIDIFAASASDSEATEAFRWGLALVSKILVRVINEGSTIVIKAINANSVKMLNKAISCAPRVSRAEWLLKVQVGTQDLSPLMWAIESGSLEAANSILKDLLTIRADRERYYYGVDELFMRHQDIIHVLCSLAPSLLPTLLEGLVWRSRVTKLGLRRVNYFVKHLIADKDGGFADAIKSLAAFKDQKIVSHPSIVIVADTLWTGVVKRQFIRSKISFLCSLVVFLLCQAILVKLNTNDSIALRTVIFIGRMLNYMYGLHCLIWHLRQFWKAYKEKLTVRVIRLPIPAYLRDLYAMLNFVLTGLLVAMCASEPMLFCIGDQNWPTENCDEFAHLETQYRIFSAVAMAVHWPLLIDMAVFSTGLAAFLLVVRHVLSELGRFVVALSFLLATFSSAVACLRHGQVELSDFQGALNTFFGLTVGLYEGDYREIAEDPPLLVAVLIFVTCSTILLMNLLIAQLNCSYEYVYADMLGFARLSRVQLIVETISGTPQRTWKRFVNSLRFDLRQEFDEGDVGLSGCIQCREPANLCSVLEDTIRRFGGSCAEDLQWPEAHEEEDRVEKLERLMQTALNHVTMAQRTGGIAGGIAGGSVGGSVGGSAGGSKLEESGVSGITGSRMSAANEGSRGSRGSRGSEDPDVDEPK